MLVSKKKLIPMLIEQGFIDSDKAVSYEAFGRKVYAFIRVASMEVREKMEAFLAEKGIEFNPRYCRASRVNGPESYPIAEVRVSYFKAWHWDE